MDIGEEEEIIEVVPIPEQDFPETPVVEPVREPEKVPA